jgi:hypothetical protein
MRSRALRRLAAAFVAALPLAALAGGPLSICGPATQPSTSNVAVKYPTATVTLRLDQGTLGPLTNAQARTLVSDAVALWNNVPTSTIDIAVSTSALSTDVVSTNVSTYYNQFNDGVNPVIYDTDGTIIDSVFGGGASDSVLGFAGSRGTGCSYTEGQAVMSGKLLSLANPTPFNRISPAQMANVITHEIGHLIGLDHTQIDGAQGLSSSNYPMMYPVAYRSSTTLHEDDVAAVSALYPASNVDAVYGTLSGTFTTSGGSPLPGANIWAQGTGGTFSNVSDYLAQGNGAFSLKLPPGTYTLHAQAIETGFTAGSSVGPYSESIADASFQPPFYSSANGGGSAFAVALGGGTPTQVTITAGCSGTVTFRINGTGTVGGNCNVTPPAAPTTVSPSGTIATTTPTYTWNAVSGATSYQLLVQNTSGVAVNLAVSPAMGGCTSGSGTCTYTPSTALANGTAYNWFVNASNSGGTSAWSAARAITVNAGTPPAVPTNVSPSGTVTTATPTYVWNASAGATSYGLLVQGPGGTIVNSSYTAVAAGCGAGTGTCSIAPGNVLINGGAYVWSVNATNASGTSARGTSSNFTVSLPTAPPPTLVSPSGTLATVTPTYTWNASAGATSYTLLVQNTAGVRVNEVHTATEAGCGSGTGTCSITSTTPLAFGATYNWFVNAKNSVGTSAWSAPLTITAPVGTAPSAPTLIAPTGTISTGTPTFSWNAVSGAASYGLTVFNSSSATVLDIVVTPASGGCASIPATCSYTTGTVLPNGNYTWQVSATNISGSATSALGSFTISAPTGLLPPAPTLVSPSGTVTTTTPTYSWNAILSATSYTLIVQNTSGVAVNVDLTPSAAGCTSGTGTCAITPATALTNGATYNWFVRATNVSGVGPWGGPNTITVSSSSAPSPPAAPTTVSPSGTVSTTTPTYTWNASASATSYYLLVQNTAGVAVSASVSATAAGCGSGMGTCSFTPGTALSNGASYNWFVNATNSIGTSAWSAARGITVSATGPSVPLAPVPNAPMGTVTTATPTYSWNASAGATSYFLLVQNTAGVAVSTSVSATSAGCGSGTGLCSFMPSTALSNGATYNWFVNASNSLGTSAWSPATAITVSAAGPSVPLAPTLVSPSGSTGGLLPTYVWNASAGATSYYLLVQNTAGVAVGVSVMATSAGCGSGTGTCSFAPSTALTSGRTYSWFVNASNSLGTSAWSAGKTITTP